MTPTPASGTGSAPVRVAFVGDAHRRCFILLPHKGNEEQL